MNRPRVFWMTSIGLLGILLEMKELPDGTAALEVFWKLGFAFLWGGTIGLGIGGITTAKAKRTRRGYWCLTLGALGAILGIYDHQVARPLLFGVVGSAVGFLVGILHDRLLLLDRPPSTTIKNSILAIVLVALLLLIGYVARNWIQVAH